MSLGFGKALELGLGIIDKFVPDERERAKAEADLRSSLLAWDQSQNEVNKAEATNSNLFVSGWRPAIGWTCACALFYQYIFTPLAIWGAAIAQYSLPKPPALDDMLWQLLFGMLGMGGLRTFEKIKGVAR